ncbi:hypothetical protein H0I23_11995 [Cellulophaga sp. HaHaR_3_176]|uniref:hypothetical protein n=1 Tax=Cellulophaga sp. HaHaR_3_176 TaxID=1942464 RepID=UPI001C1F4249|nr:hypothetical protein [Cellulophaga sp. HaHaR_3_176]QWX83170.1 hypothetical protein H0I23_11995 [Cellulophaga sp. HaHaR_3_176]
MKLTELYLELDSIFNNICETTHGMIFNKFFVIPFLFFVSISAFSQEIIQTFKAKKGDGIVSVLQGEGLDVNTNYQKFIDLNKGKISKGSELKFGVTYTLPQSETSFNSMGKVINLSENVDTPIFNTRLQSLTKKDSTLKKAVYYLLFDVFDSENLSVLKNTSSVKNQVVYGIAQELLEKGARVFMFDSDDSNNLNLGDYVAAINKRYLKYSDEYQRLLVVSIDGAKFNKAIISVEHHDKSIESKQFAKNLENIFKVQNKVFIDKTNLYIANNALPAMIFVKVDYIKNRKLDAKNATIEKNKFVGKVTTGMQIDYSTVNMEN